MKRLLPLLFVAAYFIPAKAQNTQGKSLEGTAFITGQISYASTEDNNSKTKQQSLTVLPQVGYFISPTVAVGAGAGYLMNSTETQINYGAGFYTMDSRYGAFVLDPFIRKYWSIGDKLYIFGQLDVPVQFGNGRTQVSGIMDEKYKYTSFGINLKPGLDYFLNDRWTLEATIGNFGFSTSKEENSESTNFFNFGMNFTNVGIGVKYLFK